MSTHEVLPLQSMPIGYGFRPTEEEIMNDYLKPKITGKIKADSAIIPELNICEYEAWDLPEKSIIDSLKSRHPAWFFFAQKAKYPNSKRSKRATVTGYWKSTGQDRSILTHGKKKTLVYHLGRAPEGENTGWIIHEYSTGEPEFDQAGLVLCRLFKKPEEGILISNGENIDCNIFTPNKPQSYIKKIKKNKIKKKLKKPQSSQDTTVQGDGALYEITPQHQEIVPPNLPETVDESMTKSEETHSADIGPNDELLAALLTPVDECLSELNKILGNTTESVSSTQVCPTKPETFWDNISGVGSIIGDNANVEVLLPQEAPALAAPHQMSVPICPSSHLMPLTPNLYKFDTLGVDGHYPQNSTANKLQSMNYLNENDIFEGSEALETIFRASDLSQDQFKNEPNPSGADNSTRIGVEFRQPPKKRTSANLNQLGSQGLAADGKAPRIRLQSSLRIGSTVITNRHSTRSNKDHDEKAEISESGNNAEVEMPKMAYLGPSDNDELSCSNNSQTKEPNELCVELESTLKKAPKTASINFGRVTVVLLVILCVLCIGIGWFCSYR